jgi:hypothetical protein
MCLIVNAPEDQNTSTETRLMAIILATQEAQIRRIAVQSQAGKIVHKTLFQKYPTQTKPGGVAQGIKQLPSKREALSLNSSTAKTKHQHRNSFHRGEVMPSKKWMRGFENKSVRATMYTVNLGATG